MASIFLRYCFRLFRIYLHFIFTLLLLTFLALWFRGLDTARGWPQNRRSLSAIIKDKNQPEDSSFPKEAGLASIHHDVVEVGHPRVAARKVKKVSHQLQKANYLQFDKSSSGDPHTGRFPYSNGAVG